MWITFSWEEALDLREIMKIEDYNLILQRFGMLSGLRINKEICLSAKYCSWTKASPKPQGTLKYIISSPQFRNVFLPAGRGPLMCSEIMVYQCEAIQW